MTSRYIVKFFLFSWNVGYDRWKFLGKKKRVSKEIWFRKILFCFLLLFCPNIAVSWNLVFRKKVYFSKQSKRNASSRCMEKRVARVKVSRTGKLQEWKRIRIHGPVTVQKCFGSATLSNCQLHPLPRFWTVSQEFWVLVFFAWNCN